MCPSEAGTGRIRGPARAILEKEKKYVMGIKAEDR